MAEPAVLYHCSDGVALLTLNRPGNLNAWTDEMSHAWLDAYDKAAADPECRVIVVTAHGRAWCAGANIPALPGAQSKKQSPSQPQTSKQTQAKAPPSHNDPYLLLDRHGRHTMHAMTIPKPIIACIQGSVAGGGFSQMMLCDIRFAAEGVNFTTAFSRRGLIAEMGVSQMLPRVIGMGSAMDLMLSGRKFSSDEAFSLGLVQAVFPTERLLESVMTYARDMANNVPPSSLAVIKEQLLRDQSSPATQVLKESNQLMLASFRTKEHAEGVQSFLQKRSPTFPPYDSDNILVRKMRTIQETSKL